MEREKLKVSLGFDLCKGEDWDRCNSDLGKRVLKGKIKCSLLDTLILSLMSLEKSRLEIKIKKKKKMEGAIHI